MPEPGRLFRCEQPADALRFIRQGQNTQAQGLAGQRTAQHITGAAVSLQAVRQYLLTRSFAVAVVASTGTPAGRADEQYDGGSRAEVMAPVRNTVRLINNRQTQAR